jgi:hypothetical protein
VANPGIAMSWYSKGKWNRGEVFFLDEWVWSLAIKIGTAASGIRAKSGIMLLGNECCKMSLQEANLA